MLISSEVVYQEVYKAVQAMNVSLPVDVAGRLKAAQQQAEGPAQAVLGQINENLLIAAREGIPFCQDTGMVWVHVSLGEEVQIRGLKETISRAVADAYREGYFRSSVVEDPLRERKNTGTNLPAVFHFDIVPGRTLEIYILAKGFGSENCSRVFMLKPTQGREAVIDSVCAVMKEARGVPCPPVVLGVGIGGTFDYAALLSKRALTRALDHPHPCPYYAQLESDLLEAVNALGIGPGGLGGGCTALAVKVESFSTHIAGLPVAVTVNCWADRRAKVLLSEI
ncbi:MAG: fumarate hydratase [Deltaproteobacteria bacterium]|nr:fumarate hydratase [Deltaproteobacteria bacterium]